MKKIFYLLFFFSTFMNAQKNNTRIINFGGMDWYVRSGSGNPAHNQWSDSEQSVWVDEENRLHLKIRKINGVWHSAEILSKNPTTYGKHRFFISSNVDQLNKNIVAAVFIYKDDLHEMDIEFSKWNYDINLNSQYVVQPELAQNMYRFDMNLSGSYTTQIIDWQRDKISFKSIYGHQLDCPNRHFLIDQWSYTKKQLTDDNQYRIHINLWLVKNMPPSDYKEAELILSSIDTPISAITIEGKANEKISFYANHYYNHVFVYCHDNRESQYTLINNDNKIIFQENIDQNYFFINLIDNPVGTYRLQIKNKSGTFEYLIKKHY